MHGWQIHPDQLRRLRVEARLSMPTFAHLVGCHRSTINRYERGEQPATSMVWRMLDVLGDRLGRRVELDEVATETPGRRRAA